MKYREFWIRLRRPFNSGAVVGFSKPIDDAIHVIEKKAHAELQQKLADLESKASQFENTLTETMRMRDQAKAQAESLAEALRLAECFHCAVIGARCRANQSNKCPRCEALKAYEESLK